MQFRNVKSGIDVNRLTAFATCSGKGGQIMLPVNRNVVFGLITLIAIGFVALIIGDFLH